jgi:hypothetical protein
MAGRVGIVETLNAGHSGSRRANPAGIDHCLDTIQRAGKNRFHLTVAPVSHPTIQADRTRLADSPPPIPDTLNPA